MGQLRDRMEQDLKLKGVSPATIRNYLLYCRKFAATCVPRRNSALLKSAPFCLNPQLIAFFMSASIFALGDG
jgi:hypothetical protein